MSRAPLLLPTLAFLAAIVADGHGLAAPCCVLAIVACALRRGRTVAAFALAGLVCAAWRGHPPQVLAESRTARFTGSVIGDVRAESGYAAPFALDDGMVVRLSSHAALTPGERLVVRGRLVPFDEPRNPGEPSARAIGIAQGLAGELIAQHVLARAAPDPHDARTWAPRLRAALSVRLRTVVREPEATVVAGALWGERGTLPHGLQDDFQATGTVHVLVTAGLHLGVVAALMLVLLRLARVPRIAASLATMPAVIAYAWLSGGHLPSQRAAVMVCVALLARACGARLLSWNALALAALVVAALWPVAVGSISFALSFSCVAAIGLFARPLARALERVRLPWRVASRWPLREPVLERVREALALTAATQLGVWPLSAATFGLVAPYALVANAVVVPATALAMLAGTAALVLAGVPLLGSAAAALTTWDVDAILHVVGAVAALPGARLTVAPPPAAAIVGYDLAALVTAWLLARRPRTAVAVLLAASAVVLATTLRLPDGRLTITMLDVGQGDGIVVRTPRGHTILIDSGGRLERGPSAGGASPAELVGERVVLGYLRRQGVREVALLVNTHPHGDHVGGCAPIVRGLHVAAVVDSGQRYAGRAFVDCLQAARERGVPVRLARAGMRWSSDDGVVLDVLAPSDPPIADGRDDVNENSIVLRLSYAHGGRVFRALFTGDAGAASEERLLASGADLRADVLKIGHHGSRHSSGTAFIARVHPSLALISVGRHNTFGHPAPATLARLSAAGVRTYRTDACGAIVVATDTATATMLPCTIPLGPPRRGLDRHVRAARRSIGGRTIRRPPSTGRHVAVASLACRKAGTRRRNGRIGYREGKMRHLCY